MAKQILGGFVCLWLLNFYLVDLFVSLLALFLFGLGVLVGRWVLSYLRTNKISNNALKEKNVNLLENYKMGLYGSIDYMFSVCNHRYFKISLVNMLYDFPLPNLAFLLQV